MKKVVRILALTLVAVTLCAALASCSKISGKYSAELNLGVAKSKVTYDFGIFGKVKVTVTGEAVLVGSSTTTYEGKYKITKNDDDTKTITFTFEDEDANTYKGDHSFAVDKENDAIKIDGISYTKVK